MTILIKKYTSIINNTVSFSYTLAWVYGIRSSETMSTDIVFPVEKVCRLQWQQICSDLSGHEHQTERNGENYRTVRRHHIYPTTRASELSGHAATRPILDGLKGKLGRATLKYLVGVVGLK